MKSLFTEESRFLHFCFFLMFNLGFIFEKYIIKMLWILLAIYCVVTIFSYLICRCFTINVELWFWLNFNIVPHKYMYEALASWLILTYAIDCTIVECLWGNVPRIFSRFICKPYYCVCSCDCCHRPILGWWYYSGQWLFEALLTLSGWQSL